MACPDHNKRVARDFLHTLMVRYLSEDERGKQQLAEHLLENMCHETIDKIEGPTYVRSNFWEYYFEQRELRRGVKERRITT